MCLVFNKGNFIACAKPESISLYAREHRFHKGFEWVGKYPPSVRRVDACPRTIDVAVLRCAAQSKVDSAVAYTVR